MLGVRNDAELNELLKHVHISHGGVLPCIHPSLLKRKAFSEDMSPGGHSGSNTVTVANAVSVSTSRVAAGSANVDQSSS